ncbi:MAG: glycosyltransferase family 4 protein [Betaproteobacteria bacterium]|nr:glycosyltransferase family 4 protein [Betaproteobacteria bacterium]MCC6248941.1 glycosyltransferase family 4 protein [Rubrivivax sp.]MCL4695890.1 glycosyltransferase family 4 protein [Burkholderiaceae bacterium]
MPEPKVRVALVGPFSGPSLSAGLNFPAPLPPGYPGAPLMTALAKGLVDRGHRVAAISTDYYTPVDELEPFRIFRGPGIDAYYCPQRPRSFRSSGGRRGRAVDFFAFERACLLRAIDDFRPDIVHAHWTYEFAWAALDSGYPTLVTAHDSPAEVLRYFPHLYRLARYFMARRVLRRCQHLTAVSPDLERDLRSLTRTPIDVVANPLSGPILQAGPCEPQAFDSKTLVMVNNGWIKLKNGERALEAFALARRSDPALKLTCLGADYQEGGPAQRWAMARGFAEGVQFKGPVAQAELVAHLRTSMALLHPSLLEACSMAIAEAMAVGLAVIAGAKTSGVAWQLDGGKAGVLVDVRDPASIAQAIVQLAADRARWQALSSAACARSRTLFSADEVIDRYLALYGDVLRAPQVQPDVVPAA